MTLLGPILDYLDAHPYDGPHVEASYPLLEGEYDPALDRFAMRVASARPGAIILDMQLLDDMDDATWSDGTLTLNLDSGPQEYRPLYGADFDFRVVFEQCAPAETLAADRPRMDVRPPSPGQRPRDL